MLTQRLNQAAVLMVQLVPGDLGGIVQLQKQLAALASEATLPPLARPLLERACSRLDDVILSSCALGDIEADLGADIEAVMLLLDQVDADGADVDTASAQTASTAAGTPVRRKAKRSTAARGRTKKKASTPAAATPAGNESAGTAGAGLAVSYDTASAPGCADPAAAAGAESQAVAATPAARVLTVDSTLDLLPDFVMEADDYIDAAEAALLTLEADPGDVESINVVFRAFHTIKGTSAFLGLEAVSELAHHAESLLSRVRDGELAFNGACADLSLRAADLLKALVNGVRSAIAGETVPLPRGYAEFVQLLAAPDAELARRTGRLGDILVAEGKAERAAVEEAAQGGGTPIGLALVRGQAANVTDVAQALRRQRGSEPAEPTAASDSFVRVRTDRLDELVDLVGELVVAQSMVSADNGLQGSAAIELARKVAQAGKIVRDLQDLSMSLRMVPLKATFQKINRLVRDVSRKSGKQVELITEGEDTEIDRNMVDVLGDPLVHMVRNAIDHGIETADARAAAGKPPTGQIRLRAYHSGGSVIVELQDDGRGLDRDRIVQKAQAKGLIDRDKAITDGEIYNLVFAAGFSTADQVTDLSGRGVGMDVVRRNVESIRGRVDIRSVPGQGATFSMQLPLTLAITDGMIVRVGTERYVLPTVSIQTSFRPEPGALSTVNGRGEIVLLHGEVVPIIRLHRIFASASAEQDPTRALLVVVGDTSRRAALLVDELLGQQQFVAKPLGNGMGKVEGVSGGAVLGDGRVGLILDAAEVISLGQLGPRLRQEPEAA